jgi:hypothetical protein
MLNLRTKIKIKGIIMENIILPTKDKYLLIELYKEDSS